MRGIVETDPDRQTYEIFLPKQLMSHFKTEYLKEVNATISAAQLQNNQAAQNLALAFKVEAAIPKNMDYE